jgi:hypothetical protein
MTANQNPSPSPEMETQHDRCWRYVQRLEKRSPSRFLQGIDNLVSHDYMGSSEFEWGTIPRAWRFMRVLATGGMLKKDFTVSISPRTGQSFVTIAHKALDPQWLDWQIQRLGQDEISTKEHTSVPYWAKVTTSPFLMAMDKRIVAWITVDGGQSYREERMHLADLSPVFFTVDHELANGVWNELHSVTTPLKAEDFRLFDKIRLPDGRIGKIVGIYDSHAEVELNGHRSKVPYGMLKKCL